MELIAIVLSVIALVVGNGFITSWVIKHREKKSATNKVIRATAYHNLAREVERLLSKGYASSEERKEITVLFEAYEVSGWNGDMKDRMDKVYNLPLNEGKKEA